MIEEQSTAFYRGTLANGQIDETRWYVTDFTKEQIELRQVAIEQELATLREQKADEQRNKELLQEWGQQVYDALNGEPLPEYPDEGPRRVAALKSKLEAAEGKARLADEMAEWIENFGAAYEWVTTVGENPSMLGDEGIQVWLDRYVALSANLQEEAPNDQ